MSQIQKIIFSLYSIAFVMLLCSSAFAQVTNVNPSIKIIAGKPYYIHTALGGQTMAQIATAYYTTESKIKAANANLSDPVSEGIKLKVPYSTKSVEAMSEKKVPAPKPKPKKVQPAPTITPKQKAVSSPESQPTPIEEAVTLIPNEEVDTTEIAETKPVEPETTEPTTEEQEALSELTDLSNSISESLANLAEIKKALNGEVAAMEDTEVVDDLPADVAMPAEVVLASEIFETHLQAYFDTSTTNQFRLSEYFVASLNGNQRISALTDERTKTNNNTRYFELTELHGVKIDSMDSAVKQKPIGFISEIERYNYKVKVKKKKVRVYKMKGFVEHFPKDNNHAQLILKTAQQQGLKGKGEVVILEGYNEVAFYDRFEYNPFGIKDNVIMHEKIFRIEKMKF